MTTRILVVGAGAIGGVTAARLVLAGHAVVALDANAEHVQHVRHPGLDVDLLGQRAVVPIDAVSSVSELEGEFDVALVYLKAAYLGDALRALRERGGIDTFACFGNGLVHDVVGLALAPGQYVVGITEWGATNLGPGRVAQTTSAPFVIGEVDGPPTERLLRLRDILSSVAPTVPSADIANDVWGKLLLNSTFSGLGTVCAGTYGDVVSTPAGRLAALQVWTEGYDVARAVGVSPSPVVGVEPSELLLRQESDLPAAEAALERLMDRLGATKASMLQDLERGARTEVDVINGGVVTHGTRLGRATPGNAAIVDHIHDREAGRVAGGHDALAAVASLLGNRG